MLPLTRAHPKYMYSARVQVHSARVQVHSARVQVQGSNTPFYGRRKAFFLGVSISTDDRPNTSVTLLRAVGYFFPEKEAISFKNVVNKK